MEVHLSGKLDFSALTGNYEIVERPYFSGELEDYLQRLSNFPKFDHNLVSMIDELFEPYPKVCVSTDIQH